ncbi:hypothetical protein JHK82_048192 [Glycine max]|nr:hypothetical protein JHK86_048067 [Glycine max]KAG5098338.1 hypothetical protein JHK82_048192 [Glycine max]KAG5103132.1 hypothetical protein JHK84_048101 [Glycine max]
MLESSYPSKSSFYKFGLSEPENTSHYRYGHDYEVNHHEPVVDEYRRPSENSLTINEKSAAVSTKWVKGGNTNTRDNYIECKFVIFIQLKIITIVISGC